MQEKVQELLREDGLIDVLKSNGPEATLKFFKKYVGAESIEQFTQRVFSVQIPQAENDKDWVDFSSTLFYYALDNSRNERFFSTDNEEQKMYGLPPPSDLLFNIPLPARYKCFLRSLKARVDILVCKVLEHESHEKEFIVQVISFAEKKHSYIEDFKFKMRLKQEDIPSAIEVKVGYYLRGVFYDGDFNTRKLFISLKEDHLDRTSPTTLGIIKKEDFPLHYRMSQQRPFNTLDSYMGLAGKKIPNQVGHLCSAFGINSRMPYSLDPRIENIHIPEGETITELFREHPKKMAEHWFIKGRTLYSEKNIEKALESFAMGFKYQPKNITALINRAAIYGNNHNYAKARADLELVLKIDPTNERAPTYLATICKTQADDYEKKDNKLGVANPTFRLLCLPGNKSNAQLRKTFFKCMIEYDFDDILSSMLNKKSSDFVAEEPEEESEEEEADDEEDSLPSLMQKRQQLAQEVHNSAVTDDSSLVPVSDGNEETVSSKDEKKSHKKAKRKQSPVERIKKISHVANRNYRRNCNNPSTNRFKSRTPPRLSRERSPPRFSRSRRSRTKSPQRRRRSRSPSIHRSGKSRSITPKRYKRRSYHSSNPPRSPKSSFHRF